MRNVLGARGDVHREKQTKERMKDRSTHQTKLRKAGMMRWERIGKRTQKRASGVSDPAARRRRSILPQRSEKI